ncbi:Leucine Rich repeats (2 copies) [Legionella gratiana]|uniref:Leucine Rich repeats (2 copies) n=1 Tax=Legionella gratiana TaxID=45066 RepID=A0A378JB64_9GAMM|nr:hypothetical protein [Legionella gratiana]KTD15550.1 Leucine Rich repeats (2 copies) [Legionella gratiana]STX45104.1 Ran GTPase-activating protein (RanGAP) involved in mRNA processing and transport [Legionella gratiana]
MTYSRFDNQLLETSIALQDSDINCIEVVAIAKKLEERTDFTLDLSSNPLLEKGGLAIAKLRAKGLGLAKTFITDNVVKELFTNSDLQSLNIRGNKITDTVFTTLQAEGCKLEALDLSYTEITDATIDVLMKLPNLKLLLVDFNKVSDESTLKILKMPSLCYLEVFGCELQKNTIKVVNDFNKKNKEKTANILRNEVIVTPSSDIDFFEKENKTCSLI